MKTFDWFTRVSYARFSEEIQAKSHWAPYIYGEIYLYWAAVVISLFDTTRWLKKAMKRVNTSQSATIMVKSNEKQQSEQSLQRDE